MIIGLLVLATLLAAALFGWWAARWRPDRAGIDHAAIDDDAGAYFVHHLTGIDGGELGTAVRGATALTALSVSTGSDRLAVFSAGEDPYISLPDHDGGRRFPLDVLAAAVTRHVPELVAVVLWCRGQRSGDGALGSVHDRLAGDFPVVGRVDCTVVLRVEIGSVDPDADLERALGLVTERVRRLLLNRGLPATALTPTELESVMRWRDAEPADHEELVTLARSDDPDRPVLVTRRTWSADGSRHGDGDGDADGKSVGDSEAPLDHQDPHDPAGAADVGGQPVVSGQLDVGAQPLGIDELAPHAPVAHGHGQILGATESGELAALALAGPHLSDTVLLADSPTVTGLLSRAIGAGFVLGLRTDRPGHWSELSAMAGSALVVLDDHTAEPASDVDAVVWDVAGGAFDSPVPAIAGTHPPTAIHVVETGPGADSDDCRRALEFGADLVLDGRVPGWLAIERPGRPTTTVRLVTIPEERKLLRGRKKDRVPS